MLAFDCCWCCCCFWFVCLVFFIRFFSYTAWCLCSVVVLLAQLYNNLRTPKCRTQYPIACMNRQRLHLPKNQTATTTRKNGKKKRQIYLYEPTRNEQTDTNWKPWNTKEACESISKRPVYACCVCCVLWAVCYVYNILFAVPSRFTFLIHPVVPLLLHYSILGRCYCLFVFQ